MKTYKKGISLIVLVITVLVLAILATTVIITLSNTNIIAEANEAVIKTRFQTMKEQLSVYIANQYMNTNGDFKVANLNADAKSVIIDEIFPELKDTKYYDYVSIIGGNIVLAEDMPDRAIATEVIGEYVEPEVITNYTQADIDVSNGKIIAMGKNNPLNVIAVIDEDNNVVITKNGVNSDGIMTDYTNDNGDYNNPFYNSLSGDIVIEQGVKYIGEKAFVFASFDSIDIADSVTAIGRDAFFNCYATNIILPNKLETIGPLCPVSEYLQTVTIPNSVTTIECDAFAYCPNLSDIIFTGTKAEWNAITLEEGWNTEMGIYSDKVTIHCTDGDIVLEPYSL